MTETTVAPSNHEKATPREVREWAVANGYTVETRGRLSKQVKEDFTQATGKPTI